MAEITNGGGNGNRRGWAPGDYISLLTLLFAIGGGVYALGSTGSKIDAVANQVVAVQQTVTQTASDLRAEINRQAQRIDGLYYSQPTVGPRHQ